MAIAVLIAVFLIGSSFFGGEGNLGQALQPYSEGFVAGPDSEFDVDDGGDGKGQSVVQTPLLQRAVDATGGFADRRGLLVKVEGMLERANLPLRPAEALFFYLAGVVVVAAPLRRDRVQPDRGPHRHRPRGPHPAGDTCRSRPTGGASSSTRCFPDTLQLLASTLRAGYSLMQGVEAVSQEVSEPMGRELRRVVTEARLGRPLEESMEGVAERMDSGDFAWAVMAIRIQREVGGNLAELLVTVADTMTERERLRRDVNALTAEGKVSAIVLGLLPDRPRAVHLHGQPGLHGPAVRGDHRARSSCSVRSCWRSSGSGG